jgi:hypothetical protein
LSTSDPSGFEHRKSSARISPNRCTSPSCTKWIVVSVERGQRIKVASRGCVGIHGHLQEDILYYSSSRAFSRSSAEMPSNIDQMMAGTVKISRRLWQKQAHCRPAQHAENDVPHYAGCASRSVAERARRATNWQDLDDVGARVVVPFYSPAATALRTGPSSS